MFSKAGLDEGVAGHVTVRDPEFPDSYWVNPFGMHFSMIKSSDLVRVDHAGNVVEGTWKKDKLDSAVSLSTPEGELNVPAGKVWIELVPVDAKGGSVTYGK